MKKTFSYLFFWFILSAFLFLLLRFMTQRHVLICPVRGFEILTGGVPFLFMFFHLLLVATLKDEKRFIRRFMLVLTLKFISLLIVLLTGLLMNKENVRCYVVTFLLVYITFLLFETIVLAKSLKKRTS